MQKVDGIQAVRVSLNDGLTMLDFKPGNTVTLAKLRQIIKANGFAAKESTVVARGSARGDRAFVVGGTNEEIALSGAPHESRDGWRLAVPPPKP